jgi:hypothetical protein
MPRDGAVIFRDPVGKLENKRRPVASTGLIR